MAGLFCRDDEGGDNNGNNTQGLNRGRESTVIWPTAVRKEGSRQDDCETTKKAFGTTDDSSLLVCSGFFSSEDLRRGEHGYSRSTLTCLHAVVEIQDSYLLATLRGASDYITDLVSHRPHEHRRVHSQSSGGRTPAWRPTRLFKVGCRARCS